MTKKKKRYGTRPPGKSPLQQLRSVDQEIFRLCQERTALFADLDDADAIERLLVRSRTGDSLEKLARQGPMEVAQLAAVLRELDSAARSVARRQSVAYLGPRFSYSHLAAIERFGQAGELLAVSSIAGVFDAVDRGDAVFGVVPIENSTDGRIVDTLDRFATMPVRICGEVPMRIHHNLLGVGPLSDVEEVQSKPQALSQCRHWLARHLPKARLVPSASTTAAAEAAAARSPHRRHR